MSEPSAAHSDASDPSPEAASGTSPDANSSPEGPAGTPPGETSAEGSPLASSRTTADAPSEGASQEASEAAPAEARVVDSADSDPTTEDPTTEDPKTHEVCANCQAPLDGPYCSECGQRARERIVPVWRMVNEFFEELMEWDFRILRTLPAFLFLPGRLTNAYVQGQRRRYVRPLRLYLFTSFLLFTVLAFQSIEGLETVESEQAVAEAERALREARLDAQGSDADSLSAAASTTAAVDSQTLDVARRTMAAQGMSGDQIRSIQQMALQEAQKGTQTAREALRRIMNDSLQRPDNVPIDAINWREQAARTLETGDNDELRINIGVADSTTNEQVESMLRTNGARALRNPKEFVSSMVDKGAYLMFVLLPVFAFLLKLAYVRQGRLFAEHFIFTIHIHAFTFLMFACGALLGETSAPWLSDAAFWIACSPLLYAPVAMQRVYGQGFVKTGLKTLFVFTAYSIVLCIGLVLLAVATVFLL